MFILVHGAYHAAWCWQPLVNCLEDAGQQTRAPDLPGHGGNNGWISDQTMGNYIRRIVETIDQADQPVELVGHSMSGGVIAAVGEARADKIKRLIFLAAYIPASGESVGDVVRSDPHSLVRAERIDVGGNDVISLKAGTLKDAFYSDATDRQLSWAEDRVQLQASAPFHEKITLTTKNYGRLPKAAIICTEDKAISPGHQKFMADRAGCNPVIELASGHSPFLTQPDALAKILIGL